jgi:hypothetical protein
MIFLPGVKDPRIGWLGLILISVAVSTVGGQGVYTATRNRKPTVMSLERYVKERPKATWLKLKDAVLDIPNSSYKGRGSIITEVFVPLRAQNEPDNSGIAVVLVTKDEETIALVRELKGITNSDQAIVFAAKNYQKLYPQRDVNGLVQFGVTLSDQDRHKLQKSNTQLDSNFIIIADGKKPSPIWSMTLLFGGLFATIWLIRHWPSYTSVSSGATPPPLPLRR